MMLIYYPPALYRRVICFIDPLEMIKDTVERRTRLLWPGEEEEDVTPQLISDTQYQMEKPSFYQTYKKYFFSRNKKILTIWEIVSRTLPEGRKLWIWRTRGRRRGRRRGRQRERLLSWRSRSEMLQSNQVQL